MTLSITQEGGSPKQTLWTFHTHISVLMICSEYFRNLLKEDSEIKRSKWEDVKYDIIVRSYDGFEAIMRFVYTADERQLFKAVDHQEDRIKKIHGILEIMNQANDLGMSGVRRLCAGKICAGMLSSDFVLSVFETGVTCCEDRLNMYCFNWIVENWNQLTHSWSEEEKENNNNKLIGLVRKFLVAEIVE